MLFSLVLVWCTFALLGQLDASAIPMWEFLSKQEKMSYLYSMFANQVDEFCEKSSMDNCNKELLKYGLGKLKDMPEDHLDVMDPYQRGASNIIWDSMMEGHEMMKSTSYPRTTTTAKPNSYEDESFADFGTQGAASAKIDNVYRLPPPKGFVYTIQSGTPQYTYPQNYQHITNRDKNGVYTRFQQQYTTPGATQKNQPLTGPVVVKVYPDGRPVRESTSQVPQDEDLRQYQLSKVKIPSF
ncbi:rhythmically expressed gene 5 protein [Asbolus verrucosus]|uniref:Rhythmically expressed gene 5 protein n=1 Tax=Asbolus verrucosus TaxID=1661398 RepID=A0A482W401_ASBVE|nr:rhythmically expressed gene 5 protein [Asbolus verrucosus]